MFKREKERQWFMMMKKFLILLLFLIGSLCVVCSVVIAEDGAKRPNCAFTWTFYSNYIWQGLELSNTNPFSPSSKSKGYTHGLSFAPWRNFDFGYSNSIPWGNKKEGGVLAYQDRFPLTDQTALNWRLGWLTHDTDAGENERAFAGAGVGLNTFLSPEISFWKGTELKQDAWTINFALSQNWNLSNFGPRTDGWTFGLGSGVSYSNFDNADYKDWQNTSVWADFNIQFKDRFSLTPSINYSFPTNDERKDIYGEGNFRGLESSFVFGGVALKIPFD